MPATLVAPQTVPTDRPTPEPQWQTGPDAPPLGGLWIYPEAKVEQYRQQVKCQAEAKQRQNWRFASLVGVLCIAVVLGSVSLTQGVGAISSQLVGVTLLLVLVLPAYYLYGLNLRPETWKTHTLEAYIRTLAPGEVIPDAVKQITDQLERQPTRYQLWVETFDTDPILHVVDHTIWRCPAIWGEPRADAPLIGYGQS